jgi:hypothetical protein
MALFYALLIFVIRSGWWNFNWVQIFSWGWWILGVVIGVLMLFIDRISYTYAYPSEQLSQQFTWYIKERQYMTALALLDSRRAEQEKLTFRSALFMVVWVPLAFFALTSTPSLFGKGVVMGLMLHVLTDSWRLQKMDPQRLHVRLFWIIKRVVTPEERQVFLWIITIIFVFLSLWVR